MIKQLTHIDGNLQESFETYAHTQTAHFGVEQSIFVTGNGEPPQPNGLSDGTLFSFGDPNMPNMPGAGQ